MDLANLTSTWTLEGTQFWGWTPDWIDSAVLPGLASPLVDSVRMEPGWVVAGGLDPDESFTSIKQKASEAELNRLTLDEKLDEVPAEHLIG